MEVNFVPPPGRFDAKFGVITNVNQLPGYNTNPAGVASAVGESYLLMATKTLYVASTVGGTFYPYSLSEKINFAAVTDPTVANDNTQGYNIGSRWINVSTAKEFVCLSAATGTAVWKETTILPSSSGATADAKYIIQTADAGLPNAQALSTLPTGDLTVTTTTGAVGALKSNRSATINPTINDDSAAGYSIGSRWINVTADTEWVCVDNTTGAAVWKETTVQAAGGGGGASVNTSRMSMVTAWSTSSTAPVPIEFDNENHDNLNGFDTAPESRFYNNSGATAWYRVHVQLLIYIVTTGSVVPASEQFDFPFEISKNGSPVLKSTISIPATPSGYTMYRNFHFSGLVSLAAGQYLEAEIGTAVAPSGAFTLYVEGGTPAPYSYMEVEKIP